MFAGFSLFTWFHTILSLIAIIAGFVVVRDLFASHSSPVWTFLFIATAALTSVTGFGFTAPFRPSHVVGVISLVLLAGSTLALYVFRLAGPWRWIYAISQTLAQFLRVFVLVAQVFKKVPAFAIAAVRGGRGCGACHLSRAGRDCGHAVSPGPRRHDADVAGPSERPAPISPATCLLGLAEA
jgi:hypothetical protein